MALWLVCRRAPRCASTAIVLGLVCSVALLSCMSMLELGGERLFWCSPPRGFLERYVLELCVGGVGLFDLRHFLELRVRGPMGSYGAVLGPITLARFLSDYHRLEPLADEVFCVQLLVGSEASIQACLEDVPSLRTDLHTMSVSPCLR